MADLPSEILRLLSSYLREETPSNRTLELMALCGVCRRFREVFGKEACGALAFDGQDNAQHGPKPVARFRKAPTAAKRALFLGASSLLTGYSELLVAGEAIDDQVLLNIAATNGPALTSLKVHNAPNVTDAGLCALINAAPGLKLFSLEDAGPGVVGHFMPALLQHCRQLETLLIEGAPAVDWAALRLSGAWAAAIAAAATPASPQEEQQGCSRRGDSSRAGELFAGAQMQPQAPLSAAAAVPAMEQQQPQQLQPSSLSSHPGDAAPAAAAADATADAQQQQQHTGSSRGTTSSSSSSRRQPQQQQRHVPTARPHRVSSSSLCSGHSLPSCQEDGVMSDDGSGSGSSSGGSSSGGSGGSSSGSNGPGSDSTSLSMPSQAVEALTQQLQHILSGHNNAAAAAAAAAAVDLDAVAPLGSSNSSRHHHHQQQQEQQLGAADPAHTTNEQQQRRRQRPRQRSGSSSSAQQAHTALRKLRVRGASTDTLQQLLECVPCITELHLDGPALSVQAAAVLCPSLRRLCYLVASPLELDGSLLCLSRMHNLRALELEVKGWVLSTEQLRVIGLLPLRELSLDSHTYRQHPSMPRPQYSHVDNEGIKGLVDSICSRMRTELMPLKLSLCGATALKQEAVSALLRLPILASIDTGGCVKLTPMDRMRLVAKVKAGQGLLDKAGGTGAAAGAGGSGAGGGLWLQHAL